MVKEGVCVCIMDFCFDDSIAYFTSELVAMTSTCLISLACTVRLYRQRLPTSTPEHLERARWSECSDKPILHSNVVSNILRLLYIFKDIFCLYNSTCVARSFDEYIIRLIRNSDRRDLVAVVVLARLATPGMSRSVFQRSENMWRGLRDPHIYSFCVPIRTCEPEHDPTCSLCGTERHVQLEGYCVSQGSGSNMWNVFKEGEQRAVERM